MICLFQYLLCYRDNDSYISKDEYTPVLLSSGVVYSSIFVEHSQLNENYEVEVEVEVVRRFEARFMGLCTVPVG